MPVAKSYQSYKIISEPFQKNNKWYVRTCSPRGVEKEVRWYSETEYARLYPDEKNNKVFGNQRSVFGFGDKGYIYLYKGDEKWLKESPARYCRYWGWYYGEKLAVPSSVETSTLDWETVGEPSGALKPETAILKTLFGVEIGQRITLDIKVEEVEVLEDQWGIKKTYAMSSNTDFIYLWTTSARDWEEGMERKIKGTVKEIKNGFIILTRCSEV